MCSDGLPLVQKSTVISEEQRLTWSNHFLFARSSWFGSEISHWYLCWFLSESAKFHSASELLAHFFLLYFVVSWLILVSSWRYIWRTRLYRHSCLRLSPWNPTGFSGMPLGRLGHSFSVQLQSHALHFDMGWWLMCLHRSFACASESTAYRFRAWIANSIHRRENSIPLSVSLSFSRFPSHFCRPRRFCRCRCCHPHGPRPSRDLELRCYWPSQPQPTTEVDIRYAPAKQRKKNVWLRSVLTRWLRSVPGRVLRENWELFCEFVCFHPEIWRFGWQCCGKCVLGYSHFIFKLRDWRKKRRNSNSWYYIPPQNKKLNNVMKYKKYIPFSGNVNDVYSIYIYNFVFLIPDRSRESGLKKISVTSFSHRQPPWSSAGSRPIFCHFLPEITAVQKLEILFANCFRDFSVNKCVTGFLTGDVFSQ